MEKNMNPWIWVFAAAAVLLAFGTFGMGGYGMMGFGMGFGFPFMILFWGAVAWLVIALINAAQPGRRDEDALTILNKRYAAGELSKKQHEEMKKEMRGE